MVKVNLKKGESIEKMLSRFKRKMKESKIIFELKERRHHESKKDKKKRKKKKSLHRAKMKSIQEDEI